jgi:Flp pilus assembly pilin Flp
MGALVRCDEGQDLIEYALLAGLIVIGAMAAVEAVGGKVYDVFWSKIAGDISDVL